MKNKAHSLSGYNFTSGEEVLFDANIWLYLFPPPGNPTQAYAKQYSKAVADLLKAKAKPILVPIVLSEYLNRYCRIEWEGYYKNSYPRFKKFRQSLDFPQIATPAKSFSLKILNMSSVCQVDGDRSCLEEALNDFSAGGVDFNDALLADLCKKKGFKLLTNDGDFLKGGIEILTSNPTILRACP
jgi:predicted nucleic acid-binding protein